MSDFRLQVFYTVAKRLSFTKAAALSYGNATQPGSKHTNDQLKLMSEKKLRPALLTRANILKNVEEKED